MLGIAKSIITAAAKLSKDKATKLLQNAPIAPRFKKYFQGETLGEAQIKSAIGGHKAVVPKEIRAYLTGAGTIALPLIADKIIESGMKTGGGKNKPNPLKEKRTKQRQKRAEDIAIDKALKKVLKEKGPLPRPKGIRRSGAVESSSPPPSRPKMNKGGMMDMRKTGMFYGGGMARKR